MNENIKVTITENATELPAEAALIKGLMDGLLTATNYKETVTVCDALLFLALEHPVTITRHGDRVRVLLNTSNRKTLADGIVDAIRHYFGDPSNTPTNTADPVIIIDRATAWAQAQPDADLLNPQDYAGSVVLAINKLLESNNPTLSHKPKRFDEAEHNDIVDKVQEWYNKKMEQPDPLNDEQPASPVPASQDAQRATLDTDKLKALFKSVFFDGDDYQRDPLTGKKQTRFDILCLRLEMVLTDTDNKPTDKTIGGIAYMIYCSTYTIADYQKPKRTGQKGKFANMIRTFFPIVGMSVPSDTHANKYQPNTEMIELFGDILQYKSPIAK